MNRIEHHKKSAVHKKTFWMLKVLCTGPVPAQMTKTDETNTDLTLTCTTWDWLTCTTASQSQQA